MKWVSTLALDRVILMRSPLGKSIKSNLPQWSSSSWFWSYRNKGLYRQGVFLFNKILNKAVASILKAITIPEENSRMLSRDLGTVLVIFYAFALITNYFMCVILKNNGINRSANSKGWQEFAKHGHAWVQPTHPSQG